MLNAWPNRNSTLLHIVSIIFETHDIIKLYSEYTLTTFKPQKYVSNNTSVLLKINPEIWCKITDLLLDSAL